MGSSRVTGVAGLTGVLVAGLPTMIAVGFCFVVVRVAGEALRDAAAAKAGDMLDVELVTGGLEATVTKVRT